MKYKASDSVGRSNKDLHNSAVSPRNVNRDCISSSGDLSGGVMLKLQRTSHTVSAIVAVYGTCLLTLLQCGRATDDVVVPT